MIVQMTHFKLFTMTVTPQARSLDTLCFSLPESGGEYREFIDIPAEPPKSIRKQYESRRSKPGHSQADYVNLPDDSDDSKSRLRLASRMKKQKRTLQLHPIPRPALPTLLPTARRSRLATRSAQRPRPFPL